MLLMDPDKMAKRREILMLDKLKEPWSRRGRDHEYFARGPGL